VPSRLRTECIEHARTGPQGDVGRHSARRAAAVAERKSDVFLNLNRHRDPYRSMATVRR